jgi:pSer/pThr/pTyr-binding forkhead associated (FHA) protein
MPELIFYQKGEALLRFPLTGATTQIGRGPECDIPLAGETISRRQLTLFESQGAFFAKNVGQAPAQLNGALFESSPLKNGDRICLENWEIVFSGTPAPWSDDDTYVSRAGSERTALMHPSYSEGRLLAEKISLKIREPNGTPRDFLLTQEVTTVGKGASCDLKLQDSFSSETHCKILLQGNRILLYDLNSTNGSFVNGVKVKEAELKEGQTITLGKTELLLTLNPEEKEIEPLASESFGPLVGRSEAMRRLYGLIQQVAPTDATVCILGETGTGKELVARSLQALSLRKLKPFVALNCGAISRELIESELFGHEKGAFTGAHQQRKGAFEQAHGGTLFLDETGELPLDLQPSLLRVLETGKLKRVGGNSEISVDVRVICATHRDLAERVKEGRFREDLFFRLYVFPVFLSPLRERREDILLLAQHFLKSLAPPGKKLSLSVEASRSLESREWREMFESSKM